MPQPSTAFGEELRRRRLDAGLSLTALSAAVHYSKAQLSKVERGIKAPSRDLIRLCDAALRADGALIALVTATTVGAPIESAPGEINEEEWTMQLSPDGESWFRPMGRRQAVSAGAASLMRLRMGAQGPVTPGAGAGMLEASRSLFTHYRRLGQSVEPGFLLPGLIAQTHTLRELSTHADASARQALLGLGSRYAEYVGWLVQETGDEQSALWWTQRAVDLAAAGGDRALAGYALVRRALITLYQDDAEQTVALAQRAQSGTLPPRIRGLAAQREAQGHALAGDRDACLRALDRARVLLSRQEGSPDAPVIGSMHLPDSVGMVTGWCLVDLGRPRDAAEELDRQLSLVSRDALRTQVRYGVRRALAYASDGEIDHACALTAPLLDGVAAVRSATVTIDLRRLARVLARHPDHVLVRQLGPRLSTLSRPATT
ncbi:MAG TPA: transcriptional regulator [Streptomyces sp.]|uniref:Helix-turn-helix transcriptional regulator n=1 Tax=Streptomyces salyersiae TaxID=3075530 RepID=A0ABU2RLC6_9ACTN|nr:helix-turn-helix transcriptional regulator [Streptomyces sp. DSM 41770]MDT0429650.1 helix-turn-helix transcriptional regulator [Streptomyces sp. DSM 41770]HBF85125.1 transcriptional regulator [Streptomyces sp.]